MHAHLKKFHLELGCRSGNVPWIRFVVKNEVFPFCTCGHKHNHKPNCISSLESSCILVRTVLLHHFVRQMLQAKSIKQWFEIDVSVC